MNDLLRYLSLAAVILSLSVVNANAADDPPRGKLLFLGVAYDKAPPKGQTADHYNYAPDNFIRLFQAQGKELFSEMKFETLKGGAATKQAVGNKLRGILRIARPEDLVFIYWGTHGGTGKQGWGANLPGEQQILGSEIKDELAKLPCQAVVAISTCGSGGFISSSPKKIDLPRNVIALAACRRTQSTNNELDVSLLEALAGFGDKDGDGQVTVGEVLGYVPVRYAKLMRDSAADLQPVLGHHERTPLDRALAKVGTENVAVVYQNVWYAATILERQGENAKVRYLGWDYANTKGVFHFADETVNQERIDVAGGFAPAEVEWNGAWYAAKVLSRDEVGFKIHYVGYPASDDEVVPPKRIRFPFPFPGGNEGGRGPKKNK